MRGILYLFCLASGAAALIYEIAWVRLLSVDFGATVYAVSTVLTVFMGGLALGNFLFGRWTDRSSQPLRLYAGVELLLGIYSALFIYYRPQLHDLSVWMLTGSEVSQPWGTLLKFSLSVLFLLPPATLIGGTFPLLAKIVADSPRSIGVRLGVLYGWNTAGAVLGCLGQAFYLIPTLGVSGSVYLAAIVNLSIGIGAALLSAVARTDLSRSDEAPTDTIPITANQDSLLERPGILLHVIAFASGFATLATEVLWTRLYANFLTGNVLIFATLLGGFLTGISLGSFLVSRWVDRLKRIETALGITLVISSGWLAASVLGQTWIADWLNRVHGVKFEYTRADSVYLCLLALFGLVTVPAICFGAVVPLLLRWAGNSLDSLGRDVGRLIASNTVGSILGSFVAGFVLIAALGVNASLMLLAIFYGVLALFVFRNVLLRLVAVGVVVGWSLLLLQPDVRKPVLWFNGGFNVVRQVPDEKIVFLKEGTEATVSVWLDRGVKNLAVNGLIVAESSRQDLWDLLLKAHLPMMLHEDPREIAVVGLGAGVSLGAIEAYDVDRIDCVEISRDILEAHKEFRVYNNRCWEDERARIWINDGRQFLLTTERRYDIINLDPVDPPVCNQYTQDFFQVCHNRLRDGGMTVLWVPLFRLSTLHVRMIMKAFLNVFPESTLWYDGTSVLLLGRRGKPLEIDLERFLNRSQREKVQKSLGLIGNPDPMLILATYVTGPEGLSRLTMENVPDNTDDFPHLEYELLMAGQLDKKEYAANLQMLIPYFDPLEKWISTAGHDEQKVLLLKDARELMTEMLFVRKDYLLGRAKKSETGLKNLINKFGLKDADLTLLQPFL